MLTKQLSLINFQPAALPIFAIKCSQQQERTPVLCTDKINVSVNQNLLTQIHQHAVYAIRLCRSNVQLQGEQNRGVHHTERDTTSRTNNTQLIHAAVIRLFSSACYQGVCLLAAFRRTLWECVMQQTPYQWISLEKYANDVGTTRDAIRALIKTGKIALEVHWIKCDGRIYINVPNMQARIARGGQ